MRTSLVEWGNCLLWGLLLTLVTCGLGMCGVWGWDGESGGNPLALFGLPLLIGWMGTNSIAVGVAAQAVICLSLAYLVRLRLHRRAALTANRAGSVAPPLRTNPWIIVLLLIVGFVVTVYCVGF